MSKSENIWDYKDCKVKVTIEIIDEPEASMLKYNDVLKQCEYAVRGLGYDISQLNGMERIKCVNCRKEFDSKTEIINDGELKGYKSQNMYCSYTCRDKMNKKINALSIKEVKKDE